MSIKELDTVVLTADIESSNLKAGDMGAVVAVLAPDTFEIEFVTASGKTQALIALKADQIRPVGPNDLPTVRQLDAA